MPKYMVRDKETGNIVRDESGLPALYPSKAAAERDIRHTWAAAFDEYEIVEAPEEGTIDETQAHQD